MPNVSVNVSVVSVELLPLFQDIRKETYMATTFNFELNSTANRAGKYVIMLRITQNRKYKRLKTSIELNRKSDWNSNAQKVRSSEPNYAKWNDALEKELENAKSKYRELKEEGLATADKIKHEITASEKSASFLAYARQRTEEIYNAGGIRNWKKYNGFCNKLEVYQTDKNGHLRDLTFAEITPAYLAKFEDYLHTLHNEREPEKMLHPNTIQVVLNIFRTLVKKAIEVEGLMKPDKNPFLTFKYKGVKTIKDKLDIEEIKKIESLELSEGSLIWNCRNYFLFSFYCAGIRVGDLIQLRWGNITSDSRICYEMGKNHKIRDLKLVSQARNILIHYYKEDAKPSDYIFPMLDSNAMWAKATTQEEKDVMPAELKKVLFSQISAKTALINKELKKIAALAGIDKKISFHVSRHSFAKVAKQKGVDNSKVKELLAHSSLKITEGYMGNFDTAENDKALENIFEDTKPNIDEAALLKQLQSLRPETLAALLAKVS